MEFSKSVEVHASMCEYRLSYEDEVPFPLETKETVT